MGYEKVCRVSIHAPREGCDTTGYVGRQSLDGFQFTHPGRGATDVVPLMPASGKEFQFTHPGRGATKCAQLQDVSGAVSIHAPREGCDQPYTESELLT